MDKEQGNYPKIYMYRRIVYAKLYIDNWYYQDINLDILANEAFFSKFHFIRLFKLAYGKTPHQYLRQVRINQACLMLKTGMHAIDVCYAVGFVSISSFSALFKQVTGYPPAIYAQMALNRNLEIRKMPLKFIPHCFAIQYS